MSPRDLTYEALDAIGVDTISAASARQLARIARDLTATMQLIYSVAPALYKRRDSAIIAAPQDISVTATNGSQAITVTPSLVEGSTIQIGGDTTTTNEVLVGTGSKTVRFPFNGLTGTYPNSSVWGDSIPLGATVDRVIGAVMLNEKYRLDKRNNREDAYFRYMPEPDYGRRIRVLPSNRGIKGQPSAYWVEASFAGDSDVASHKSSLRIRLFPLPNKSYTLTFDVRVKAPRFVVADLGVDATDSTKPLVVAADMIEAIVRPIFLKNWSASPWFKDKDSKKDIGDQAEQAHLLLQQYRPQQPSNRRIVAPL